MIDPTGVQLQYDPYKINKHTEPTFAPVEDQVLLSIFRYGDAKYLSFPTYFLQTKKI